MEELREASIHHTALKFSEDIKQMKVYSNLYKTVQVRGRQVSTDVKVGNFNHFRDCFSETCMLAWSL